MKKEFLLNNRKVVYTIYGEKNKLPLVLLHGFCEDASVWQSIVEDLSKTYKVVVPDLPGFGQTESWFGMTIPDMADVVNQIILHAAVYNPVIIGHSMGGYISLAYADQFPESYSGIGLFHSTILSDSIEKKDNRLKTAAFIQDNGSLAFAKVLVPTLFAKEYTSASIIEEAIEVGGRCSIDGLVHATLAMRERKDYTDVFKKIIKPTLIISGKHDAGIPVNISAHQASLPNICSFHILEKSGHTGMKEQPIESILYIHQFLNFCY